MTRAYVVIALLGVSAACTRADSRTAADNQVAKDTSAGVIAVGADSVPVSVGQTEYYGREMLSRIAQALSSGTNPTRTFGRHPTFWYVAARRTASGSAEVHDRWIDVTFIQEGRGTLLSGGAVAGSHLQSAGEHRGGTIGGGTKRTLGPGDFLVIPAGVPHQYQLARGDSLLYLTVKVLNQPNAR